MIIKEKMIKTDLIFAMTALDKDDFFTIFFALF
jgi:hypothetical protein